MKHGGVYFCLLFLPVWITAQVTDDSKRGDVLINEVMVNAKGLTALPETEYVEIFNVSSADISLNDWAFVYDGKDTKLPDVVMRAGNYAVLYRDGREIIVADGALLIGSNTFPSAMANTGKTIGLKNTKGEYIDEMTYPAATAGFSFEREEDGTWHLSTDEKGGTPGTVNSPTLAALDKSRPGDVLINEVMVNVNGLTALPQTEYVEIYNVADMDMSLDGWSFVYDGKDLKLPDVVLPSRCYAVLYRAGRDIIVVDGALPVGFNTFPSTLANTGKTIGLKNAKGEYIDEMTYPPATPGISYERGEDGTWHLSTDTKGGTPGTVNSPSLATLDKSRPGDVLINEVMVNINGLTVLPQTEYVEIYNVADMDMSLNGWSFVYDGKDLKLPDVVLPSRCYAVLYRAGRDIIVAAGALPVGFNTFPSTLANTGKAIGLKNARGEYIDEMTYPPATPGISYERGEDGTWHLSTDTKGGTPGAVNSSPSLGNGNDPDLGTDPAPDPDPDPDPGTDPDPDPGIPIDNSHPGDVLINEVMANAKGLTALPETEYVEIYNASDSDISLNGWSFVYDGKDTKLPDVVLPGGDYAVLYRSGRDISVASGALSLGISTFPSTLATAGKTIGLKKTTGETIDEMTYPTARAGISYERGEDGIWHLSTDEKGGTPGAVNSFSASVLDNSKPGDVLINEVMANVKGLTTLPETEYVEIYNVSGHDISLNSWSFVYEGKGIELPNVVLPAGAFAVLYRAGRDIVVANGAISIGVSAFPSTLANVGKTIGIKNAKGEHIDEMTYLAAKAGVSYERNDDGSWYLSTDEKGGTPGAVNSPPPPTVNVPLPVDDNSIPGDVLINEVMANPKGLTMLPETEYVEIYNTSQDEVNLYGWAFIYDDKETFLPNVVLPAGGYAVLFRDGRAISVAAGTITLGISNFPSALANTSKAIGLKNSKGVLIDEMTYPNAIAGKSYERAVDESWHESTDRKGGTPGAVNSSPPNTNTNPDSQTAPIVDNSRRGDVLINEVMANPKGLTVLPETEYVEIYNPTDKDIWLNGWVFVYNGTRTALPAVDLQAGGYAVLYRAGRSISVATGTLSLGIDKFPSALANTGKTIGLINGRGIVIDEMTYPVAIGGKSYERAINGTWHESTDSKGGTPGAVNSPPPASLIGNNQPIIDFSRPGDVLISEVMADPKGLTALPETEYVEIYNVSGNKIPLKGWTFIYDGKETSLPDVILSDEEYAVLYCAGRDIVVAVGSLSLGIDKFPSALANTGKTIGLKNAKGVFIDEMTYPNAKPGKSYERADDGSWHVSTDEKGGTPGTENSNSSVTLPVPDDDFDPDPNIELPIDNSQYGDVLINEIMANPNGLTAFPETEYVEIFNASGDEISLNGWSIVYDGKETLLPDVALIEDSYAVLYRAGREIIVADEALALGIGNFPSALANTSKTIGIINTNGELVDEMTYPNAKAGKSYERAHDGSWHVSTDERGGTPGEVNSAPPSQAPNQEIIPEDDLDESVIADTRDIIINEIMPEEFLVGSEYIELYNRSNRTISLTNLVIAVRRTDGSLYTHYPLSSIKETISLDSYVVLTKDMLGVTDFYFTPENLLIYELKLPTLNNNGASLVLFRKSDGIIIDEVSYDTKWHSSSIKSKKGVALERIDPDGESQDPSNWSSATVDVGYGTPGYKNSQYKNTDLQDNNYINTPEYVPGYDYYLLTYQTTKPGYRCRMEIYSTGGNKVAELMNNQLIAQEGELKWDGKGVNNNRLTPGVYVFYAELYHPDGNLKRFKKAFLVR